MELSHVRAFVAVAEELHFGRAAERLHVAQPPLSRTIKQLENDLGSQLFHRTTRSVRLTASGEALLPVARDVLNGIDRARFIVRATSQGEVGHVSLAFAGASTHVRLGVLARAVREEHPGIDLRLHSSNFALPALERVINHEMDIAFGRWSFMPDGVDSRIVEREHVILVVPAAHPLADRQSVSFKELRQDQFVTLPPHRGSVLAKSLDRLSQDAGFVPEIVQEAPDTWTLLALVAAGVGCALTVSSVASGFQYPGVRFCTLQNPGEEILLRMAWLHSNQNAALAQVVATARGVFPDEVYSHDGIIRGLA